MSDATGWLLGFFVEQAIDGVRRPTWVRSIREVEHPNWPSRVLGSHHEFVPTHDANEALRFARRRDAETALDMVRLPYRGIVQVEEHIWTDAGRDHE